MVIKNIANNFAAQSKLKIMNPEEQIKEINSVLNRVGKFKHISGWAPVWAGLVGSVAYFMITNLFNIEYFQFKLLEKNFLINEIISSFYLSVLLGITLLIALVGILFIMIITNKKEINIFDKKNALRMGVIFGLYILLGAVILFQFYINDAITTFVFSLIPSLMISLYGLAQIQVSNYSLNILKYFGVIVTFIGILSFFLLNFAWLLWLLVFGLGHFILGTLILLKEKRELTK